MFQFIEYSGWNENTCVQPWQNPNVLNENQVVNCEVSATITMKRAGSGLSLSHSELTESLPILFEICGRVVVDFVFL